MKNKMRNLKKAIAELNAPKEFDGDVIESQFDFTIREENGRIEVFDKNECYCMYYAEEVYCMMMDAAAEFGFEPPSEVSDNVFEKLEAAVKEDFGKDAYIGWYDNVVMCVAR